MAIKDVDWLVDQTRRHLYGSSRPEYNRLAQDADSTDKTLNFEFNLDGITKGSYLGINAEVVYVWSVDITAKTATVERAVLGTASDAHSIGDRVEVDSRYPNGVIRATILDEIRSWPSTLFTVDTVEIPASSDQTAYDLDGVERLISPLVVRYMADDGHGDRAPRMSSWDLDRDADRSKFPSGLALYLRQTSFIDGTIRFTYAQEFEFDQLEADPIHLPAGTADVQGIDENAVLIGYAVTESASPEADAEVVIRHGTSDSAPKILPTINLGPNESRGDMFSVGIPVPNGVYVERPTGNTELVLYRDFKTNLGLPDSMLDIPPIGAAWRLMSTGEVSRTSSAAQPEPRRAEEVPPGHRSDTARRLQQLRSKRISEEAARLRNRYGRIA